jgi:hypothetical protein
MNVILSGPTWLHVTDTTAGIESDNLHHWLILAFCSTVPYDETIPGQTNVAPTGAAPCVTLYNPGHFGGTSSSHLMVTVCNNPENPVWIFTVLEVWKCKSRYSRKSKEFKANYYCIEFCKGGRGSVVGWGTMLQAGKSPVRIPDEVDF